MIPGRHVVTVRAYVVVTLGKTQKHAGQAHKKSQQSKSSAVKVQR